MISYASSKSCNESIRKITVRNENSRGFDSCAPVASNMNASDNRLCFRNFLKFVVMLDALYADYSTLIISTKELKYS